MGEDIGEINNSLEATNKHELPVGLSMRFNTLNKKKLSKDLLVNTIINRSAVTELPCSQADRTIYTIQINWVARYSVSKINL